MIYRNGVQDDTVEITARASDSAFTDTIELDCTDGHTFSLESGAVTGCVVEFRHEDDVSWTNIETTPYDLSAFAGTRETFEIRYDPSAATAPQALKFRVGPAA